MRTGARMPRTTVLRCSFGWSAADDGICSATCRPHPINCFPAVTHRAIPDPAAILLATLVEWSPARCAREAGDGFPGKRHGVFRATRPLFRAGPPFSGFGHEQDGGARWAWCRLTRDVTRLWFGRVPPPAGGGRAGGRPGTVRRRRPGRPIGCAAAAVRAAGAADAVRHVHRDRPRVARRADERRGRDQQRRQIAVTARADAGRGQPRREPGGPVRQRHPDRPRHVRRGGQRGARHQRRRQRRRPRGRRQRRDPRVPDRGVDQAEPRHARRGVQRRDGRQRQQRRRRVEPGRDEMGPEHAFVWRTG
jgi:hypothetical protein